MATQPATMPIEEYLQSSYSPDMDFVDGCLEERNLGEFDHARLQTLIAALFANREPEWAVTTVVEQRMRVAPYRVRICDVALLRADARREKVTATAPLLCIEVLSPEDRLSRAKIVLADYLAMGVEHVWLIDPMRRAWYTFDSTGLHEQTLPLSVAGTEIRVDVEALFARLD